MHDEQHVYNVWWSQRELASVTFSTFQRYIQQILKHFKLQILQNTDILVNEDLGLVVGRLLGSE